MARRLLPSGRSRALVWGRTCARSDLEALGERLLEVSSQHEARRLAQPSRQLELLDAHAGCDTQAMAAAWRGAPFRRCGAGRGPGRGGRCRPPPARPGGSGGEGRHGRRAARRARGASGREHAPSPPRRADRGRSRSRRAAQPGRGRGRAVAHRPGGRVGGRRRGVRARQWRRLPPSCATRPRRLQEAAVELRGFVDGLEADSGRLEHVEARLELFAQLERRYAAPLERVLAMAAEARTALERLDGSQSELERLSDASAAAAEQRPRLRGRADGRPQRGRACVRPRRRGRAGRPGDGRRPLRSPHRAGRPGAAGSRPGGARAGGQPGPARRAGRRHRVRRRAVAHRACDQGGRPCPHGPGRPAARRGRRRHRRPHRPGGGGQAAAAGRGARRCS